jgi:hypothetical protein
MAVVELIRISNSRDIARAIHPVMRGLDSRIHLESEPPQADGLPGAQTSLRGLRKADHDARQ